MRLLAEIFVHNSRKESDVRCGTKNVHSNFFNLEINNDPVPGSQELQAVDIRAPPDYA